MGDMCGEVVGVGRGGGSGDSGWYVKGKKFKKKDIFLLEDTKGCVIE